MTYDTNNIFAKILRGEIPNKTVLENEYVLAFHDIHPQAPVHILVIPKGAYTDIGDFGAHASEKEIAEFYRAVSQIAKDAGLTAEGYRVVANTGVNGGQDVPHFHVHIIGGEKLGSSLRRS
ncbi:MAG: HIT domain-containing protein [Alphaproteobacteria bacterium]|nr:HIT domain-containing protein [Alphaproteobacteria bacterium]